MRTLIISIVALAIGFGTGYYWNSLNIFEKSATENTDIQQPNDSSDETTGNEQTTVVEGEVSSTPETAEPVVVDTNVLSPEQRKLLETFGIEADSIEVTADMIACAKEKVGEARFEEILSGDTPSFFEGLSLAACYQQ